MSKIITNLFRSQNERLLKVKVYIDYPNRFDRCSINIKSASEDFPILSTSVGSIVDNKVFVTTRERFVQLFLEYIEGDETHCLLSYFKGKELIDFDVLPIALGGVGIIKSDAAVFEQISSVASGYLEKSRHIAEKHNLYKTQWRALVSVSDDIVVRFIKRGSHKTFMIFGETTPEIISSDSIFPIEPKITEIVIPKELVWSKYDDYSSNATLACCLVVKTDFHSLSNKYTKVKISNILELSDLPRKKEEHQLSEFTNPFGQTFKGGWKVNKTSNLPIYIENS